MAVIDQKVAEPKAQEIIRKNVALLPDSVLVERVALNPGSTASEVRDSCYNSTLTVEMNGRMKTLLMERIEMPFLRFFTRSISRVKPK